MNADKNNPFALDGKVVVITGASSGIGRAVAQSVAQMGGLCVLNGQNETRLNETLASLDGSGHVGFASGLTDEFIKELVKNAVAQKGPIGALVHCAGIEKTLPFRATEISDLREIMSVNLEAFWLLTQATLRRGNFAKDLSVVAIGSAAGTFGAKGKAAYAASKGALVSLVYSLAAEYAHQKLRFNCVCPGQVNTPMLDNLRRTMYTDDKKFDEFISSRQPLGLGQPEDVASAVVYLLSGAAKWVTGSVFSIDGGYGVR